jgi:hypothetical protein
MKQTTKRKLWSLLPWLLTVAVLGAALLYGYVNKTDTHFFETKFIKVNLLATMRIHLLEAIEAEKSAVLAITDKESENFAARARQAADRVESSRNQIATIIQREQFPRQSEMLNEFNACWSQFRQLDDTILALATQNTNLKAQQLSATQGAQAMTHFEESLQRLILQNSRNSNYNQMVIRSYEALTAGLTILTLHKPHIEEADDQKMEQIEHRIKAYDASVRKALTILRTMTTANDQNDLKNASDAYDQFMNLTHEILKLSRMNTNIKSEELSLGKKRLLSSQCLEILTDLQMSIQAQGNYDLPKIKAKSNYHPEPSR